MRKRKAVKTHFYWRKKRIILLLLIVAFLLLLPVPIFTVFLFHHVNYSTLEGAPDQKRIHTAEEYKLEVNERTISTADGEYLWCAEVPTTREPRAVVIFLSGLTQPSVTAFYGHAQWLQNKGYISFLLEVRAHGESSGNCLGFGYTEIEDLKAMVRYIKLNQEYKDLPLVVYGVSLGGTIALNGVGEIPEIDGCIAVSPMASLDTQLDLLMKEYHIPKFIRAVEVPILKQVMKLVYGKDAVDQMNPISQIQKAGDKADYLMSSSGDRIITAEITCNLHQGWDDPGVWTRDSGDHFVIQDNDFKNIIYDKDYCDRVITALLKSVQYHKTYVGN